MEPWDPVAVDLIKLPLTTEGHKYLMVTINHFSRFCILVPLKEKQAASVARALIGAVFCKFNTPRTLLLDNGSEFNSQVLEAICSEYGIVKTNIVACHPASNGLVERQNRTILQHLRTLVGDVLSSWNEWMPQVMDSLNSSQHTTIGDTPRFTVFGQDKNLLYTIVLKKKRPFYNFDDYVRLRKPNFQKIYKRVQSNIFDSKIVMNEQQWQSAREKIIVAVILSIPKYTSPRTSWTPPFRGSFSSC